jgi:hypothetical protein
MLPRKHATKRRSGSCRPYRELPRALRRAPEQCILFRAIKGLAFSLLVGRSIFWARAETQSHGAGNVPPEVDIDARDLDGQKLCRAFRGLGVQVAPGHGN